MWYLLLHKNEQGEIWSEIYTVKGHAEGALARSGHKGLVIQYEFGCMTNYGLVEDLTDHTDDIISRQ